MTETIFSKSQKDHHAYSLPEEAEEWKGFHPIEEEQRKAPLPLPEISELDLTRHLIGLSRRSIGIDTGFYPLGSCTMKFNPRINECIASLPNFAHTHPLSIDMHVQGNFFIIFEFLKLLTALTGMDGGSLAPNAGAQGELTGIKLIAAYHKQRNDVERIEFLVPDSAHGTNPASVTMAGFKIRSIPTDARGDIDLNVLKDVVSNKTAGLMLTNPNTLGLFSSNILKVTEIVHEAGGLLYYDGANLNPILALAKPGEMGFDVMHVNLHKTFSTPHGGGGPGSGPILCNKKLLSFLPIPRIEKKEGQFESIWKDESSIGQISPFYGNFGIYLRAFAYAKMHGIYGLQRIAKYAVLNANYLKKRIGTLFTIPFPQNCMHEFVVQADRFLPQGIKAFDIAKRILDFGVHAPTVYFPLIIKESFLIEPTESESKKTLDRFVEILEIIVFEAETNPELIKKAPYTTYVRRLDEVEAAKNPILIDPLVTKSLIL